MPVGFYFYKCCAQLGFKYSEPFFGQNSVMLLISNFEGLYQLRGGIKWPFLFSKRGHLGQGDCFDWANRSQQPFAAIMSWAKKFLGVGSQLWGRRFPCVLDPNSPQQQPSSFPSSSRTVKESNRSIRSNRVPWFLWTQLRTPDLPKGKGKASPLYHQCSGKRLKVEGFHESPERVEGAQGKDSRAGVEEGRA